MLTYLLLQHFAGKNQNCWVLAGSATAQPKPSSGSPTLLLLPGPNTIPCSMPQSNVSTMARCWDTSLPTGTAILGHKAGSQHLTPSSFQLLRARPISSRSTENIQEAVTAVNLPLERDPHPGIQRDVSSNLLSPLPRHPYLAECDSLPEKNQGRLLASSARAEKTHKATKMEQSLQK